MTTISKITTAVSPLEEVDKINEIIDEVNSPTNSANKDFSNISSTGKNIGNWSTNVSNCITEIPQDIKLELNNGTITLKAGSKVYVPNGSGVFDVKNITSDLTTTETGNGKHILTIGSNGAIRKWSLVDCFSGSTAPTGVQYPLWYDTTNNLIKISQNGGQTWESGDSLPLCIFTVSSGAISSIDQVFNGFGYIGSTVFALPGVKGLIPNGRNDDGTLKNIDFEANNLILFTDSYQTDGSLCYALYEDNTISNYFLSGLKYNEQENMFYYNGHIVSDNIVVFANYEAQNYGKIVSFYPKTVFRALDWNDKGTIVGFGRPDYNSAVSIMQSFKNSTYTVQKSGFYVLYLAKDSANSSKSITVNGIPVCIVDVAAAWQACRFVIELSDGDVLSAASGVYNAEVSYYIPYKM